MKKSLAVLSVIIIFVVVVSAFAVIEDNKPAQSVDPQKKPLYVGVTYSGTSILEAEKLIDRVRNYTNLFILQSGTLMQNLPAMEQVCDYAVNAGLNIIVYYSTTGSRNIVESLLNTSQSRWGSHFLGLYYNDEPGGNMLDSQVCLNYGGSSGTTVTKSPDGSILVYEPNDTRYNSTTQFNFSPSGIINVYWENSVNIPSNITDRMSNSTIMTLPYTVTSSILTYFPNGTVSYASITGGVKNPTLTYLPNGAVQDQDGIAITDKGDIYQFEPYQTLWNSRPLKNCAEAANTFVNSERDTLNSIGNQSFVKLFTADYGLYWFDYKSGYDVVFTEFGWNNSRQMNVALCRGAASIQGRDWGVMITWTYDTPPYIESVTQLFDDMKFAYKAGSSYVVVFNSDGRDSQVLSDDQFKAIQQFWQYSKSNPNAAAQSTNKVAYVLPEAYGYAFRGLNDSIWGLWEPDNFTHQQVTNIDKALSQYGNKLDIIYDDFALYAALSNYSELTLWNETTS
jgi:hypothetical protein